MGFYRETYGTNYLKCKIRIYSKEAKLMKCFIETGWRFTIW